MTAHTVFIAAGTNIGSRLENLQFAAQLLAPAVKIRACSKVYQTEPWGVQDQAYFLNLVWQTETTLPAESLLQFLKSIENRMGREKSIRYGPRLIDLDILLYDDLILRSDALTIPHPQMSSRRFVLTPLCDLIPDGVHPESGKRYSELLAGLPASVCEVFEPDFTFEKPIFRFGQKSYLMGIINLTADSFSEDGILSRTGNPAANALSQAKEFLSNGADILDLGAESTRPGFTAIAMEEEIHRLIPALRLIKRHFPQCVISVDTTKARVAAAVLAAGADWINDIHGASDDEMAQVIAEAGCPMVLMRHEPLDPNQPAIAQVQVQLEALIAHASEAGIRRDKIMLDPGIGFGTTAWQNMEILQSLPAIRSLGYPLLVGPSRKSFIGHLLQKPVGERLSGTAAAAVSALQNGADILRLHDVKFMKEVLFMTDLLKNTNRGGA